MSIIYLSGFMGCGKSTVGKLLAQKLGCFFTDLDTYIEKQENMTVAQIFDKYGEDYFRDKEHEAIGSFVGSDTVVATGGGALTFQRNIDRAKADGKIVFIDTPFKVCYRRIKNCASRPIASKSRQEELKELYSKRLPVYIKDCDYRIKADNDNPDKLVDRIISLLNN